MLSGLQAALLGEPVTLAVYEFGSLMDYSICVTVEDSIYFVCVLRQFDCGYLIISFFVCFIALFLCVLSE